MRTRKAGSPSGQDAVRRAVEAARACESELEPLWGPYDVPEKAMLEALVGALQPAKQSQRRAGGSGRR
jgi:hypothetical protein